MTRDIVPKRRCSSSLETAGCLGRCEKVHCHVEPATIYPASALASEKKFKWLQKAQITVILSQDIMLDDNAIYLPLFRT